MTGNDPKIDLSWLRRQILGCGFRFHAPFGDRLLLYADYTASGRSLRFLERYLMRLEESYANTHTEDDETGRSTTRMLHHAEEVIKRAVNGNKDTCIIATGTGATGAIKRLMEILGVHIPPATRAFLREEAKVGFEPHGKNAYRGFIESLQSRRPVVFLGPYEHHSNEISWRESLAEIVEIDLTPDGGIDLDDLVSKISRPEYEGRVKIGSFSAASNVTGILTPVHDVAATLHRHGALACFDYAASAPYVPIDMNRDNESYLDAVFLSPHKFLGGPGTSGLLLFNRNIYRTDLPPTFPSGGTVDYVGYKDQDYIQDIEAREKPGTPGALQIVKCMLAFQLKQAIGQDVIEDREKSYIRQAMDRFSQHPGLEVLGNPDPERRLGIVSFNIRHDARYLHPKFVTRVLNDLFGIQSRAGCSCAGPYGHRLLNIGQELSDAHRKVIQDGCLGLKPGWARVCFHYTMDESTVDFICRAIEFLADSGHLFLDLYRFDLESGSWSHLEDQDSSDAPVGLDQAVGDTTELSLPCSDEEMHAQQESYLAAAMKIAEELRARGRPEYTRFPEGLEELAFFRAIHVDLSPR